MSYGGILGQNASNEIEQIENSLSELQAEMLRNAVPVGSILLWSGAVSNIPEHWALCNGQNGTPNLTNRFIVGAGGTYAVGATGGSDTVTLSVAQMPSHNHSGSISISGLRTDSAGEHSHVFGYENDDNDYYLYTPYLVEIGNAPANYIGIIDESGYKEVFIKNSGAHTHTINASSATATLTPNGNSQAHENRPPYYALCYIMKVS